MEILRDLWAAVGPAVRLVAIFTVVLVLVLLADLL